MTTQSTDRTLRGSCLCGSIQYLVHGRIGRMSHCHCSMCRKAHGAAFGTYGPVAWDRFEIVAGEENLRRYRSSQHVTRTFCGNCGSTLQFVPEGRPGFGLAVSTLDDDPGGEVTLQIWAKDKAPWWTLSDDPPYIDTTPHKTQNNGNDG